MARGSGMEGKAMTPEEQRVAIAGACGWTNIQAAGTGQLVGCFGPLRGFMSIPDYPNDLNAMRDAALHLRKTGNQFQWLEYHTILFLMVTGLLKWSGDSVLMWDVIEATSAQRAEAMCRTLWPERWKQ